jgi:hypothetical protein
MAEDVRPRGSELPLQGVEILIDRAHLPANHRNHEAHKGAAE